MSAFSGLKMETVFFSEMLVSTYKSTRRHNPEDHMDIPMYIFCKVRSFFPSSISAARAVVIVWVDFNSKDRAVRL
jgi:hypothetical protein